MSSKGKGKKRAIKEADKIDEEVDLFSHRAARKGSDDESDDDTTDSEDSEYSGLEEEEDSSEPESIEDGEEAMSEGSESTSGGSSNEEGAGRDEDDSNDSDSGAKTSQNIANNNATNKAAVKKLTPKLKSKRKRKSSKLAPGKEKTRMAESQSDKPESEQLEFGDTPSTSAGPVTVNVPDEYEFDSSDEEDLRNTVGNIPMEWYREYEHIGYNVLGKKLIKPASGDQLDNFLNKMDNPDYWRTVVDPTTGQNVVISDKDAEMIKKFRKGKYVDPNYDPYAPWIDFFTYEVMKHPVTNRPADKRSFIPSRWERLKVGRMVHALKMGWMKPKAEKKAEEDKPDYYMLWSNDETADITNRYRALLPAPKLSLPGHDESYNPPPEYLLTEEEELAWKNQEPEERRRNFIPQKFSSLRQVPGYSEFIQQRFERCLDLYLCPRQRKLRMNVNPEDLLPKLPKPKELQPFPSTQAIIYKGHDNIVRSFSVEPGGQWLVSGSDDETIKFWEVSTGRCMKTLPVGGPVKGVAWNPNASFCLVAALVGDNVLIINPQLGDKLVISNTDNLIESYTESDQQTETDDLAKWSSFSGSDYELGFRLKITHAKELGQVTWHARGDYLAVVVPGAESRSVLIHQISRRRSQNPFRKPKGLVQCVLFHPIRPFLFVATQRHVRVYNLLKQELTKKLMTNAKWVSSMAVHPGGDNIIIGSYDCRLSWFDLDLSTKPYQTLRHHKKAIRQVCYHKKYPLFASGSDDGSLIICHGRVYNDLLQNALIVPVKVLRGHEIKHNLGVLCVEFHPTQPWIFSSAGDHTIRLWS